MSEVSSSASSQPYKRRGYFNPGASKRKRFVLEPGMKGFLCSCNFKEKECIRESYNILNRYYDKHNEEVASTENKTDENEEEVEDELLREVEGLKSEVSSGFKHRFQVVESGAKNFLFIKTQIEDPVQLAVAVAKDVFETKQKKTRFLLRLVPIEATCRAYIDDIKKACEPLIKKHFESEPQVFSIAFNHRNNNTLSRDKVIQELADMVTATRSDHSVNLSEPKLTIIVEVIKSIVLLAVVPDYIKYKKYNLHMIVDSSEQQGVKTAEKPDVQEKREDDTNGSKHDTSKE